MTQTYLQRHFWAIADTHLSFGKPKDMARFGEKWEDHAQRLALTWKKSISPDDVVMIPGDVSWAQSVSKFQADLAWLSALPGRKVLLRGNHDHWWKNIHQVRKMVEPCGFYALEGDSVNLDGVILCGAMGYLAPQDPYFAADVRKDRYQRELNRLGKALNNASESRQPGQPMIVLMHYPPFTSDGQPTAFVDLITQHKPTMCLYGHLHRREEWQLACNQDYNGVLYQLVAADFLQMTPRLMLSVTISVSMSDSGSVPQPVNCKQ